MKMDSVTLLNARIRSAAFVAYEVLQSQRNSQQRLKILFSPKPEWESDLRKAFRRTHHTIAFGELSAESIVDCQLVVPLAIRDLTRVCGLRNLIPDNPIPIPSMECITLCDDKYLFNQSLAVNGFERFLPRMGGNQRYPYILKKRIDEWGEHSYILSDAREEESFSSALSDPEYFSQEFVAGRREYATHIVFRHRQIVCSLSIEYFFGTDLPVKGRDKPNIVRPCRCPYLKLFSSVLASIDFEGLCCINYKVQENRPLILEINPRFGGSLRPYFFSFVRHLV
jgi:hypothetical protein